MEYSKTEWIEMLIEKQRGLSRKFSQRQSFDTDGDSQYFYRTICYVVLSVFLFARESYQLDVPRNCITIKNCQNHHTNSNAVRLPGKYFGER